MKIQFVSELSVHIRNISDDSSFYVRWLVNGSHCDSNRPFDKNCKTYYFCDFAKQNVSFSPLNQYPCNFTKKGKDFVYKPTSPVCTNFSIEPKLYIFNTKKLIDLRDLKKLFFKRVKNYQEHTEKFSAISKILKSHFPIIHDIVDDDDIMNILQKISPRGEYTQIKYKAFRKSIIDMKIFFEKKIQFIKSELEKLHKDFRENLSTINKYRRSIQTLSLKSTGFAACSYLDMDTAIKQIEKDKKNLHRAEEKEKKLKNAMHTSLMALHFRAKFVRFCMFELKHNSFSRKRRSTDILSGCVPFNSDGLVDETHFNNFVSTMDVFFIACNELLICMIIQMFVLLDVLDCSINIPTFKINITNLDVNSMFKNLTTDIQEETGVLTRSKRRKLEETKAS